MSNEPAPRDPIRVTETELSDLLSRAIQLDAKWADGFSIEDAREIARQAGISDAAINSVLEQFRRDKVAPTVKLAATYPSAVATGALVGSGLGVIFALGRVYAHFLGDAFYVAFSGMALIPALVLAAAFSGLRKHRRFQLLNLSLWSAAMAVWTVVGGPTSESSDIVFFGGWLAGLAAAQGSAIIWFRDHAGRFAHWARRLAVKLGWRSPLGSDEHSPSDPFSRLAAVARGMLRRATQRQTGASDLTP
jgi:hypothetical protein